LSISLDVLTIKDDQLTVVGGPTSSFGYQSLAARRAKMQLISKNKCLTAATEYGLPGRPEDS